MGLIESLFVQFFSFLLNRAQWVAGALKNVFFWRALGSFSLFLLACAALFSLHRLKKVRDEKKRLQVLLPLVDACLALQNLRRPQKTAEELQVARNAPIFPDAIQLQGETTPREAKRDSEPYNDAISYHIDALVSLQRIEDLSPILFQLERAKFLAELFFEHRMDSLFNAFDALLSAIRDGAQQILLHKPADPIFIDRVNNLDEGSFRAFRRQLLIQAGQSDPLEPKINQILEEAQNFL